MYTIKCNCTDNHQNAKGVKLSENFNYKRVKAIQRRRNAGGYGNLGNNYSARDIEGSESFIGTALGQIGIFAIIYVVIYCVLVKRIKKSTGYYSLCKILLWLNIGLLIMAFVNNEAISYTNCYIFYILSAINIKEGHVHYSDLHYYGNYLGKTWYNKKSWLCFKNY